MSQDDEYIKQAKRLRDQIEVQGETLQSMAHRQDEFAAIGVDIRADIVRMNANQAEILRQIGTMSSKIERIGRKLELIGGV
jgi:hypothetical protein